jgi:hypothetical protein
MAIGAVSARNGAERGRLANRSGPLTTSLGTAALLHPMPMPNTFRLDNIQTAARRLAGQVLDTSCVESNTLSQSVGAQVFLKVENLQFIVSFKERGALNKLAMLLDSGQPLRGVIADLAGNHAQGVAHHAPPWAGRRPHRLGRHRRTHDREPVPRHRSAPAGRTSARGGPGRRTWPRCRWNCRCP